MNFKKTLFAILLTLGCANVMAQHQCAKTETVFNPHWYVRGQVGGQYTLGEVKFSDLLSPNAQIVGGYNFTDIWGLRLDVNAWQSKGGSKINDIKYKWKYNYVAPTLDATINLTNLLGGFKANRICDVTLFAGIGANIAFSNDEAFDANQAMMSYYPNAAASDQFLSYLWDGTKTRLVGKAGVDVDFRISKAVALGLEVSANTLGDHYNSKKAGNSDWYFNALVGVKVNLGKTSKEVPVEHKCCKPTEKIVEKIVEKPVEKIVYKEVEKKAEPLRRDVFFTINATKISAKEMKKVEEIAMYLNINPSAKVAITGYADKGTGNATINKSLSERRAAAVVKALKEKFGIDESRITFDSKGDTEQPFEENNKNRVSICIAQ